MSSSADSVKPETCASAAVDAKDTSATFTQPDASSFKSRQINLKIHSVEQAEGMGARVRRSIGGYQLRNFDPFLMLDFFKVTPPAGFPDHPHRGFETVTYMLPTSKGIFTHEDFTGVKGDIGPGSTQWMTAGRGIVHSEMPANGEVSEGLQLWVNLASKDKMCEPGYQEFLAKDIPKASIDGITASVISGSALGVTSPVKNRTPVYYFHFWMEPNKQLRQPIPQGWNAFLFILEGEAAIGSDKKEDIQPVHHTLTLKSEGDGVSITTFDKKCSFVLIAGKPLNEPVVQHGPFVMNTREEIMQAIRDYQYGANGFERAPGWKSKIGRKLIDSHGDDSD